MGGARHEDGTGKLLLLTAVVAAALGLGAAWWMAQPDYSTNSFTRLSGEIGCQCGTCPLRPIATCGCGYADGMLAELRELIDSGQSDEQVMTTLVARYDASVRIKPEGAGLGLAAWAAPILLLTVGAVGVGSVLARWTRRSADNSCDEATTTDRDDDARLREIVERELSSLED